MSESTTAEFMALFRALESGQPARRRLFTDPLAAQFLRPSLKRVAALGRIRLASPLLLTFLDGCWPGARASGVARTRFIDDAVEQAVESGVRQVVLLGAGYDCRAHRLDLPGSIQFFEVDELATQRRKAALVKSGLSRRRGDVRYVPCDFERDEFVEQLEVSGFDVATPTVVVLEGVTNYLSSEAVDALFSAIRPLAPGSVFIFTYVERGALDQMQRYPGSRLLRRTLRSVGEPWTFGLEPNEVEQFLRERGFRLVEDCGSVEYRRRYSPDSNTRGYEFYRVAVASVELEREGN